MKRSALPLLLVLALATAGTAAAAVPKPGKFRGKTEKGDPMGLTVIDDGLLKGLFLEGVKMKCTDGYKFNTPTKKKKRLKNKNVFAQVQDDGSWLSNDDNWDPYGVYIDNGQFNAKGKKTTGQLHVATTISKNHKHKGGFDHDVNCDSGPMTFELKRQ